MPNKQNSLLYIDTKNIFVVELIKVFLIEVIRLYKVPNLIILNRNKIFNSIY